jgi:hypothetical protein
MTIRLKTEESYDPQPAWKSRRMLQMWDVGRNGGLIWAVIIIGAARLGR